ncbi:MAG: OB-fold nucleic acid binding domain-containing protein, partial [Alloacidobacterium sp.]
TAKGVIFMTLEDETDIANIIVWPKVFEKNRRTVMTARFLAVRGRLQRAGLVIHVVADSFVDLSAELPWLRDGMRDGDLPLPVISCPSHQEGSWSRQEESWSHQEASWRMLKSRDFH